MKTSKLFLHIGEGTETSPEKTLLLKSDVYMYSDTFSDNSSFLSAYHGQ